MDEGNNNNYAGMHTDLKLFVGGLLWDTTDEGLKMYFEQYGPVLDVNMMRDRFTGQPRGFAFVTVGSEDALRKVMSASKHIIDGKEVEIKQAIHKNKNQNENDQDDEMHPTKSVDEVAKANEETRDQAANFNATQDSDKKIFVGGLLPETREKDLEAYFGQFGEIKGVVIKYDSLSNRSRGFGFVAFGDIDGLNKACESSMHTIQGKRVEIKRYNKSASNTPATNNTNTATQAASNTPQANAKSTASSPDTTEEKMKRKKYSNLGFASYKEFVSKLVSEHENHQANRNSNNNEGGDNNDREPSKGANNRGGPRQNNDNNRGRGQRFSPY